MMSLLVLLSWFAAPTINAIAEAMYKTNITILDITNQIFENE